MIRVYWPKKAARVPTDVTGDVVRKTPSLLALWKYKSAPWMISGPDTNWSFR